MAHWMHQVLKAATDGCKETQQPQINDLPITVSNDGDMIWKLSTDLIENIINIIVCKILGVMELLTLATESRLLLRWTGTLHHLWYSYNTQHNSWDVMYDIHTTCSPCSNCTKTLSKSVNSCRTDS